MKSQIFLLATILAAGVVFAADDYEVKIKERTHACRTPEDTYRFWSLARRDKEAAAKYSNEKGCLMIPAGYTVALVEVNPIAKINGIRLKGDPTVYYVPASDAK